MNSRSILAAGHPGLAARIAPNLTTVTLSPLLSGTNPSSPLARRDALPAPAITQS